MATTHNNNNNSNKKQRIKQKVSKQTPKIHKGNAHQNCYTHHQHMPNYRKRERKTMNLNYRRMVCVHAKRIYNELFFSSAFLSFSFEYAGGRKELALFRARTLHLSSDWIQECLLLLVSFDRVCTSSMENHTLNIHSSFHFYFYVMFLVHISLPIAHCIVRDRIFDLQKGTKKLTRRKKSSNILNIKHFEMLQKFDAISLIAFLKVMISFFLVLLNGCGPLGIWYFLFCVQKAAHTTK